MKTGRKLLMNTENGYSEQHGRVQETDRRNGQVDADKAGYSTCPGNGTDADADGGSTHERNSKRPRGDFHGLHGPSSEEMDSYKRSKLSAQDPMNDMLGRDEIVQ